jgi:hypothetical protein
MNRQIGERVAFTWNGRFFHGVISEIEHSPLSGGNNVYITNFEPYDANTLVETIGCVVRKEWQLMTIVQ